MGIYLNPGNQGFKKALNSEIYVDKSELIAYTNMVFNSEQQYVCVSRPRRFGKSIAASMLAAYYDCECDSTGLFDGLAISKEKSYREYLNQYNVIFLNIQSFLSRTHDIKKMKELIERYLLRELLKKYPHLDYFDKTDIISVLQDVFEEIKIPFVFIIDEWDCIFRENQQDKEMQKVYLDFLRNLLKDANYVGLAYMTGILPIKKYGTHSALNMFDEFSMINPKQLAKYVGFTEKEVKDLCEKYEMNIDEVRRWYDGYQFQKDSHIYNPRSVVSSMISHSFDNYWTQTETYEALKVYVEMNYDGLKDTIIKLLSGERQKVEIGTFTNDMMTFQSADDVLTLLIHLGYLGYDFDSKEIFIPNSEISGEFVSAVKGAGWNEVVKTVRDSDELLKATWNQDTQKVVTLIEKAHMETSILTYNNENALSYTISLAYYSARVYYTIIRELPTGKGFADLVFLPRKNHLDKPAMIVELKWNHSAKTAINQIKEKVYVESLREYQGNLLLVGINYDETNKKHSCKIELLNL